MILEVRSHTRSIDQNANSVGLEKILGSDATELEQAWGVHRPGCNNDVGRGNKSGVILRIATVNLNSRCSRAVGLEYNLRAIVSDEQVQVRAAVDWFVVRHTCRRSLACDAAHSLGCPDKASVVAVRTIVRILGVEIVQPGSCLDSYAITKSVPLNVQRVLLSEENSLEAGDWQEGKPTCNGTCP